MSNKTGGPAFPAPIIGVDDHEGMTLRDYFAAKALSALIHSRNPEDAAAEAYEYADAMLKAREA